MDSHSRRLLSRWWFFSDFIFNVWTGRQVQAGETQTKRSSMSRSCSRSLESTRYPIQSTYNVGRYTTQERRGDEKRKKVTWRAAAAKKKETNGRIESAAAATSYETLRRERGSDQLCVCKDIFMLFCFSPSTSYPTIRMLLLLLLCLLVPLRNHRRHSTVCSCCGTVGKVENFSSHTLISGSD